MKRFIFTAVLAASLMPLGLQADEEIAADTQVAEQKPKMKDNFGSKVAEEAKRFREDDERTERNFGEWVSSQRSHRPARHHGRPETKGQPAERRNQR
jgi:hypothetical protein